jgi:hypothetical protein
MDFLAFIVPGFLLSAAIPFVLKVQCPVFINITSKNATTFDWVSLVVSSFVLGHFLHHMSALIFNPIYEVTYFKYKKKKHLAFIRSSEEMISKKIPIKKDIKASAEAYLKLFQPHVVSSLEKYEANAKLFRSLCALSIFLCFAGDINYQIICLLCIIAILSFTKFANQKFTHQLMLYQYFVLAVNKA